MTKMYTCDEKLRCVASFTSFYIWIVIITVKSFASGKRELGVAGILTNMSARVSFPAGDGRWRFDRRFPAADWRQGGSGAAIEDG